MLDIHFEINYITVQAEGHKMQNDNKIEKNLKKLLFENNLTPTELARQIDLPQQTIQRIVKGKIKNPHIKTLESIAKYFGMSAKDLSDEQSLFPNKNDNNKAQTSDNQNIPVYEWNQLQEVIDGKETPLLQNVVVSARYNEKTFGVIMSDSSMSPYFPKESILIIEPSNKQEDRSFVLAHLTNTNKFLFRQLLSDGENFFLKALSSDLASFPIKKMEKEDKIIGCLVETRHIYAKFLEGTRNV